MLLISLAAAFLIAPQALGFVPAPILSSDEGAVALQRPALRPLYYRALDEDDDENTMFRTQNRVPVGYDMRKAIKQKSSKTAMNIPLIRALLGNQSIILGIATGATYILLLATDGFSGISNMKELLHWTGGDPSDMDFLMSVALGVVGGAFPMLAVSKFIEKSDNPDFANINFSTIIMAMTLFGRRKAPPPDFIPPEARGAPIVTTKPIFAAIQSLQLALTTALCEETVFRQLVPGLISRYTGDRLLLPLLGGAALFGLGHSNPKVSLAENGIVVGLQVMNGLIEGLLYVVSGGNIVPCIVAHAVYDFIIFFATWMDANAQIEYAEAMYLKPLSQEIDKEVKQILSNAKVDPKKAKVMKRLFYIFDFDKNEALSLSEVRKGFAYMAIEKAGTPPPQKKLDEMFRRVAGSDERLDFAEFLLLFAMKDEEISKLAARRA